MLQKIKRILTTVVITLFACLGWSESLDVELDDLNNDFESFKLDCDFDVNELKNIYLNGKDWSKIYFYFEKDEKYFLVFLQYLIQIGIYINYQDKNGN